jgi:superfamily II DNA/RNA helicase
MSHQIALEFQRFGQYIEGLTIGEYYGGVSEQTHKAQLRQQLPTIAIGTPGRMAALIRHKYLPVHNARRIVLDECDLLLASSIPMRADCQAIFKAMPKEKQVIIVAIRSLIFTIDTDLLCYAYK